MRFQFTIIALLILAVTQQQAGAVGSRIKDLTTLSGARDNQLVGYGLVTGLANDGDKDPVYTVQSMANFLQRHNVTVPSSTLSSKNVAAVMVTANIGPFLKSGAKIDVTVSAIGDAKSLQGGILGQCPLEGADGEIYAVAQGALAVGGFVGGAGGAGGATVQKNHPTVAQIVDGAIVEKEIQTQIIKNGNLDLLLREPDFTSAARIAVAINNTFTNSAQALDSSTVRVRVPADMESTPIDFVSLVESIEVTPDTPARIVINERTGTIVATAPVRIASCMVSHGDLTITIAKTQDVSQPNAFSQGTTTPTTRTATQANEAQGKLIVLREMPTINDVAAGLNAIKVTPRDMMAIFQSMKQAGALQAELMLR
jgi:flagellar P-ring protein precursor FlgI